MHIDDLNPLSRFIVDNFGRDREAVAFQMICDQALVRDTGYQGLCTEESNCTHLVQQVVNSGGDFDSYNAAMELITYAETYPHEVNNVWLLMNNFPADFSPIIPSLVEVGVKFSIEDTYDYFEAVITNWKWLCRNEDVKYPTRTQVIDHLEGIFASREATAILEKLAREQELSGERTKRKM